MKNAWSGGQYSLFRAVLGVGLCAWFLRNADWRSAASIAVAAGAVLACAALAAGFRDRPAAVLLLFALVVFHRGVALISLGWLLLAHAFTPAAPLGSLAARGRPDPAGGWGFPQSLYVRTWFVLALNYAYAAWSGLYSAFGMVMLHLLAFNPGWIPPRRARGELEEIIIYDGGCALCHGSVRFVLGEDDRRVFRFAPLGGKLFMCIVPEAERAGLPDTVVVRAASGELVIRHKAWAYILGRLGGWWRVVGGVIRLTPPPLGRAAYDLVARTRYRIFGRTADVCPRLTPELRARFEE